MSSVFVEVEDMDSGGRLSRPTLAQVKAVVEFMQKHPDLGYGKPRNTASHRKFKKLWIELSNIVNSMDGAIKSTKGWIKFWSDKKRSIASKQRRIAGGKLQGKLSSLEQTIVKLSHSKSASTKGKSKIKQEPCNGDDDSEDEFLVKEGVDSLDKFFSNENEERQLSIMEKLVDVMAQQATAMSQIAQAQMDHSKSLERYAEASHIQALAVDRLAGTFENISSSVHDVRNALLGIDYTMKRCYPDSASTQIRQNSTIFS